MKIFILLLTITGILTGCSNSKPAASGDAAASKLNGTWELNYITGPRIAFDGLYPTQKPTLIFRLPAKEVDGNTSCNPFSCNITIEGNKITFGDARSTMMACEGGGEQTFLNTLKKVNLYNVKENTLTLIMGDIAMMRFVKK